MEIKTLFDAYETQIGNLEKPDVIFRNSGMQNISKKLDYGFFPLGSGIVKT